MREDTDLARFTGSRAEQGSASLPSQPDHVLRHRRELLVADLALGESRHRAQAVPHLEPDRVPRPLASLAHLTTDVTTARPMSLSDDIGGARPRSHHPTVRPLVMTSVEPPATLHSPSSTPVAAPSQPARSLRSALVESRAAALVSLGVLAVGVALRLYHYL